MFGLQPNVEKFLSMTRSPRSVFYLGMKQMSTSKANLPGNGGQTSGTQLVDCREDVQKNITKDGLSIGSIRLKNHQKYVGDDLPMY